MTKVAVFSRAGNVSFFEQMVRQVALDVSKYMNQKELTNDQVHIAAVSSGGSNPGDMVTYAVTVIHQ